MAVELPSLEVTQAAKDTVMVSSLCMSLENIKLIQELLYEDIGNLEKIDSTFVKYVNRIQFFIENKDTTSMYPDKFKPNKKNFQYINMSSSNEITEEQFENANHYILFQDIEINEPKQKSIQLQKWEQCLVQLLLETDLTSYCNKLSNSSSPLSAENPLRELFWQIHKAPTGFLIDSNKGGEVKVMAYFLSKYFENISETNLVKEFNTLRDYYQKEVEDLLERQERLEQSLHLAINSLTNQIAGIESRINNNNSNVFQCLLARKVLDAYTCSYEITQEMPLTNKRGLNKDIGLIMKGDLKKYVINLEQIDKSQKSSKKKTLPHKIQRISEYYIL